MKNLLVILVITALLTFIAIRLFELQDKEYDRYSDGAKKECTIRQDKELEFDNQLKYWRCINRE